MSQEESRSGDPAFKVTRVNLETGETTIVIQKGILGALGNQLQTTSNQRSGAGIIRKMGFTLKDCGDLQYGEKEVDQTEIDPEIVEGEFSGK
jgi:hypothetical protein